MRNPRQTSTPTQTTRTQAKTATTANTPARTTKPRHTTGDPGEDIPSPESQDRHGPGKQGSRQAEPAADHPRQRPAQGKKAPPQGRGKDTRTKGRADRRRESRSIGDRRRKLLQSGKVNPRDRNRTTSIRLGQDIRPILIRGQPVRSPRQSRRPREIGTPRRTRRGRPRSSGGRPRSRSRRNARRAGCGDGQRRNRPRIPPDNLSNEVRHPPRIRARSAARSARRSRPRSLLAQLRDRVGVDRLAYPVIEPVPLPVAKRKTVQPVDDHPIHRIARPQVQLNCELLDTIVHG